MNKVILPIAVTLFVSMIVYPLLTRVSNCGGNSAALAYVGGFSRMLFLDIHDQNIESPIPFTTVIPREKWSQNYFSFGWGVESYWVRKVVDPGSPDPVIVCAQEFGNVPRPGIGNFYKRNPGHAAGYLNGKSRIISPAEYEALNLDAYFLVKKSDLLDDSNQSPELPTTPAGVDGH